MEQECPIFDDDVEQSRTCLCPWRAHERDVSNMVNKQLAATQDAAAALAGKTKGSQRESFDEWSPRHALLGRFAACLQLALFIPTSCCTQLDPSRRLSARAARV